MEKLVLIDGNSLINRAFYAMPPLNTKEGVPTGAVYGFMNMFFKMLSDIAPDYTCVAFGLKAPTFRHKMYADYKGTRKPMPDNLRPQIPLLKELLSLMGVTYLEKEGFEADDILGTLAHAAAEAGEECVLATGDRDALQLVDEHVTVLLAATRAGRSETEFMTPDAVKARYGLSPDRLIDLKALMGDSSDNIPGVAGVGEKTAVELLKAFGSLDALYAAYKVLHGNSFIDDLYEVMRHWRVTR